MYYHQPNDSPAEPKPGKEWMKLFLVYSVVKYNDVTSPAGSADSNEVNYN